MLFSSYIFLFVFLPPTLVGFCLLSRWVGPKPAKLWLILASLVFYGWWNPVYVGLILASMLFNFWVGRSMGRAIRSGGSGRTWLFCGIAANLLLLGYFKYANFFVSNFDALFGSDWTLGKIILPLGISFFTFTQIAYLADVGRGVVCEYDLGDFLLFITFFPHLIAGPKALCRDQPTAGPWTIKKGTLGIDRSASEAGKDPHGTFALRRWGCIEMPCFEMWSPKAVSSRLPCDRGLSNMPA